jgi:acetyl esterase/lipase
VSTNDRLLWKEEKMRKKRSLRWSLVALCVVGLGVSGCDRSKPEAGMVAAKAGAPAFVNGTEGAGPSPAPSVVEEPAPKLQDPLAKVDKDMQEVLTELQSLGGKPIETLTAIEARKQPSPADAVKALLKKQGKSTEPEALAKVEDRKIPSGAGSAKIPVRVYTPTAKGTLPIIVYYHGGGFVIADNDTYDATPRALSNGAKAVVVSVEYRKGPENKFPTAQDDAFAAYRWVTKNALSLGGDTKRIAVAGESAGGNLAENVAIAARDQHERQPVHVLLVYPVASANMSSESYQKYRDAKPLNKAMMIWFTDQYFRTSADARDPRINLVDAKLTGLPETTIVNAEIDPLLSDGKELADRLKAAEVPVKQKTYSGVTHEFFGMGSVVSDAKDAVEFACDRLRKSFEAAATSETALSNDAAKP